MLLRTDNVLLTQVSRLPSCVSGEGVVLCSGAPMGTLVVAHSVGTVSTSDLAVALGCIGKARVPNPSPFPLVVGFSLPESVLATVVGSAELCPVFLPCWFASAVMNSGVGCVFADRAVGGCCVDAPRRLRRCLDARLARSEALSHRLFLMACCSASGIGQPLWLYFTLL